jgi:mono/diheme cytochrome c family protein
MRRAVLLFATAAFAFAGCDKMANQPKRLPYETYSGQKPSIAEGQPPAHIVARDWQPPPKPPPVTPALLARGRQRYDIYCEPCHDPLGDGDGIIVQRGFPHPPSYHTDRLRSAPNQHFYDVITHGYGAMYSYASRVAPTDRWAIVAYIRALQASQNARLADLPPDQRAALQRAALP